MRTRPLPPRWLPPTVLAALGAALLLRRQPYWYDELFTVQVTSRPLSEIAVAVRDGTGTATYLQDVPPAYNGPYYVVARLWQALPGVGADEVSLRLLSLLPAVAAVAVLVAAVERLAGRSAAVAAGLVAATSPLVLEQALEARSYGLALLATACCALGLARWLDGGGLWLFGVAGAAMGLAHWFAVPALVGLAVGGALASRRLAPLLVGALAGLPTLGLVLVALLRGRGADNARHLDSTGGTLAWQAVQDAAGGSALLVALILAAAALGLLRAERRAVAACWLLVPLSLLTLVELVLPVYEGRYLLPALLGLAVLAGCGVAATSRPVAGTALLVVAGLLAGASLQTRGPKERADAVVDHLLAVQQPGEPVVAVDARSALGLEHYGRTTRLRADLLVPPEDPPPTAGSTVWLVRHEVSGQVRPSDDDAVLVGQGYAVVAERVFKGRNTDLRVQRWSR